MKRVKRKYYGFVYLIINNINGKKYVGQTTSSYPRKRWNGHTKRALDGYDYPLYRSMRKYGIKAFTFGIIYEAKNKALLDEMEEQFIRTFKTLVPNGYNLTYGGDGGGKRSAITKNKMKLLRNTPEYKISQSESQKIIQNLPEVKERHRQSLIAAWARPGAKEKRSAKMKESKGAPEKRLESSIAAKLRLSNPENRAKHIAAVNSPEVLIKRGEIISNTIWINNGRENRRIQKDIPIPEGFVLGRFGFVMKNITKTVKNTKWINNGIKNRRIDINESLPELWTYGRTKDWITTRNGIEF